MVLLRVIFIAQLVLLLPAFAYLLLTPASFGALALLFYLVPVGLLAALFALWQFVRHPTRRRLAAATFATPFLCLAAPIGITWFGGGPVAPAVLIIGVIALVVIAALVLLSKTGQWRGTGLFSNRRFNVAIIVALGVLFTLLWFPIIAWLASDRSYSLPSSTIDRDRVLSAGALYLVAIAVPGFCLSLFSLLYAPVGLVRNPGGRFSHFVQLVLALILLASLIAVAAAAFVGMINPG